MAKKPTTNTYNTSDTPPYKLVDDLRAEASTYAYGPVNGAKYGLARDVTYRRRMLELIDQLPARVQPLWKKERALQAYWLQVAMRDLLIGEES